MSKTGSFVHGPEWQSDDCEGICYVYIPILHKILELAGESTITPTCLHRELMRFWIDLPDTL